MIKNLCLVDKTIACKNKQYPFCPYTSKKREKSWE